MPKAKENIGNHRKLWEKDRGNRRKPPRKHRKSIGNHRESKGRAYVNNRKP